jgi:hypothetical protein
MPAGTPVQVRLPDDELGVLDAYRRGYANPPSRAQAARELIRRALSATDRAGVQQHSIDCAIAQPGGRAR